MSVELHQAFFWHCDNCGAENFCRALVPEMSEEDEAELKAEFGIDSWEQGRFLMAPEQVKCQECGVIFETEEQ